MRGPAGYSGREVPHFILEYHGASHGNCEERVNKEDPGFRRLQEKHREYDLRLKELRSRRYLSDDEKLEEVRLKKRKLVLKDRMEAMLAVG